MNRQINLRLPGNLLEKATEYAARHGYGSVQELIKEAIRHKVFDESHHRDLVERGIL